MKRKVFFVLLACICTIFGWAQTRKVSGRVVADSAHASISGVSVTVKGTQTSTAINKDGVYSIAILDRNDAVLVFFFVGSR